MTGLMWALGVLAYLAVGVGMARLRAWQVMGRPRRDWIPADLRAEMLALMFLWPALAPCYLLAMMIRWVLFPRSMR